MVRFHSCLGRLVKGRSRSIGSNPIVSAMKIEVDIPTPRDQLIKAVAKSHARTKEELQSFVGNNFFLEVVEADFEISRGGWKVECSRAVFKVPGSDFVITLSSYDLMDY